MIGKQCSQCFNGSASVQHIEVDIVGAAVAEVDAGGIVYTFDPVKQAGNRRWQQFAYIHFRYSLCLPRIPVQLRYPTTTPDGPQFPG